MSNSKLLKEAIADAKAVKATALANAKAALTEAFTPKLQSMISAKMMQEMDDEDMDGTDEMYEEDEMEDEVEAPMGEETEDEVEETWYEETEYEDEMEENEEMESEDEEDLELEAILRELEDEESEELSEEDEDELEEQSDSSEIGTADNKVNQADGSDTEDPGEGELTEEEDEDGEIDINEIIKALREDDSFMGDGTPDGDADEESREEEEMTESLKAELKEAYRTIKLMKNSLNETNLLNAKLLFSNKLFKAYDLNESQKLKVIDNFDRAQTLREVKLVYATLAESMKTPAKRRVNESASRVVGSTAPKKAIINESKVDFASRMQQLAGIKKIK